MTLSSQDNMEGRGGQTHTPGTQQQDVTDRIDMKRLGQPCFQQLTSALSIRPPNRQAGKRLDRQPQQARQCVNSLSWMQQAARAHLVRGCQRCLEGEGLILFQQCVHALVQLCDLAHGSVLQEAHKQARYSQKPGSGGSSLNAHPECGRKPVAAAQKRTHTSCRRVLVADACPQGVQQDTHTASTDGVPCCLFPARTCSCSLSASAAILPRCVVRNSLSSSWVLPSCAFSSSFSCTKALLCSSTLRVSCCWSSMRS